MVPAVQADDADDDVTDTPVVDPATEDDTEPADDETGDRVDYVRTGIIRVWIDGERYRLRRPFFGEFKRFRLAVEDMNDEIDDLSQKSIALGQQITAEAETQDRAKDPEGYAAWRVDSRRRQREVGRNLTDTAEQLRIGWWEDVWATLALDERPPDWPSWITNPELPNRILTHWRMVPSGRG
jgi:hypothetical protein